MQPAVNHARYEDAVKLYKQDLNALFARYELNKSNEDFLFWMMFHPDLHFSKHTLSISLGKNTVQGVFSIASFQAGGHTFVLLPAFNNYMCMAGPDESGKVDIEQTAIRAITGMFRMWKKDLGPAFDPSVYYAPKRQFVTAVDIRINIKLGGFSFEQKGRNPLLMHLRGDSDFDGEAELQKTGADLNRRYPGELKRAMFREDWVRLLYERIFSPGHIPLAIVGEEGVGRHSLVEEVVYRYLSEHEKTDLRLHPKVVWHLDPVRVISGMSIVGMWQKRMEAMINHVVRQDAWSDKPDIILVDNPVALLRVGRYSGGNMALSDVLRPYLENRRFTFILIATPEEWSIIQEQDRRFSGLFQVWRIDEAPRKQIIQMLLEKRKMLEREYRVSFQVQALEQMLQIHRNYLSHRALPGGVAKMMDQLAIRYRARTVDAPEVRAAFQLSSGLAEVFLDDSLKLDPEEVEEALSGMLVGQPEAFQALTSIVHLAKSKLADKTKPIGSLLFAGPTGVGKTQAAKALSKILTGSESALMRFDMNEYGDAGAVQRLIGDFSNPEGKLTTTVRHNPFGVLLLDELEKAHPKVHDLLLQLLDDGRLTDGIGRTVDFTNVVVIMTSNLGAREASQAVGFAANEEDIRTVYVRAVEKFFRPEFVNRIDHIIAFRALDEEQVYQIARLQLRELLQRDGFVRRTSILNVDQSALRWVAKRGYDGAMGGRALKRQLEKDLTELSADQLLATSPDSTIILDIYLEDDRLKPRIQAIGVVQPAPAGIVPVMPAESLGRDFLQDLLRRLEHLRSKIKSVAKGTDSSNRISEADMAYYEMIEQLERLKDKIKTLLLSYKGSFLNHRPVSPLRLKLSSSDLWDGAREHYKEKMFRDEAVRALYETYRYAVPQFNPAETLFMELYLDTVILEIQAGGFEKGYKDRMEIRVASLVAGEGGAEKEILLDNYTDFFRHLGMDYECWRTAGRIEAEGYGLYDLMAAETGVHLFKSAFGTGIPLMVWVRRPDEPDSPRPALDMIRLYDKTRLMTDLRTGLTTEIPITPQEFKLLIYSGAKATGRIT